MYEIWVCCPVGYTVGIIVCVLIWPKLFNFDVNISTYAYRERWKKTTSPLPSLYCIYNEFPKTFDYWMRKSSPIITYVLYFHFFFKFYVAYMCDSPYHVVTLTKFRIFGMHNLCMYVRVFIDTLVDTHEEYPAFRLV